MTDYGVLRSIGLSKAAAECYESLFHYGMSNAAELAARLGKKRCGLYRVLHELEAKGFVASSKVALYPFYFRAEPLDRALRNYSDYQWRLVGKLFEEQREILAKRSGRPDHYRGHATF